MGRAGWKRGETCPALLLDGTLTEGFQVVIRPVNLEEVLDTYVKYPEVVLLAASQQGRI